MPPATESQGGAGGVGIVRADRPRAPQRARRGGAAYARTATFPGTTVGQKVVLAVTGAVFFVFVVLHLLGNLLIFAGRDALNSYAAMLKSVPEALWLARLVLLLAVALHVLCAVEVTIRNWTARPTGYTIRTDVETNYAGRTMIITGPLILLYVVYHLMMFTFLTTGPGYSRTDVYANVTAAFRVPAISVVYIVAMLMLGTHLYHGAWSMLHSMGISNPRYRRLRRVAAPVAAILITLGYIAIPLAVLTRVLT